MWSQVKLVKWHDGRSQREQATQLRLMPSSRSTGFKPVEFLVDDPEDVFGQAQPGAQSGPGQPPPAPGLHSSPLL
jgi:hypothetical protein